MLGTSPRQGLGDGAAPAFLAVDFFCGAGGTTRGLIDAGGYVIAGIDKDAHCGETFVRNNRNGTGDRGEPAYLERDIFPKTARHPSGQRDELLSELDALVEGARIRMPGVPLLVAICAPCQPFTRLAKQAMTKDRIAARSRDSNLLMEAAGMVGRYLPEMVVSENVGGIADPRYGGVWDRFQGKLRKLGYVLAVETVCASRFGVAQKRRRTILVAVRKDAMAAGRKIAFPAADPGHEVVGVGSAIGRFPPLSAGEVHASIPNHRASPLSDLNLRRISYAVPGGTNSVLRDTAEGDLSLPGHRRGLERTGQKFFADVYSRMHRDAPAPTITTKCHRISNGRFGHYDPAQLRAISLREAAALQSFPDDYVFYPEKDSDRVARMIGNAVPPKLSRFFAEFALAMVEKKEDMQT